MKEFAVRFYLGNFYHSYVIEARNEADAYITVLNRMPDGSKEIMHDLNIKRHHAEW